LNDRFERSPSDRHPKPPAKLQKNQHVEMKAYRQVVLRWLEQLIEQAAKI
jgi:hypothetical protein